MIYITVNPCTRVYRPVLSSSGLGLSGVYRTLGAGERVEVIGHRIIARGMMRISTLLLRSAAGEFIEAADAIPAAKESTGMRSF